MTAIEIPIPFQFFQPNAYGFFLFGVSCDLNTEIHHPFTTLQPQIPVRPLRRLGHTRTVRSVLLPACCALLLFRVPSMDTLRKRVY
ncbi:MAG: hypothetical protein KBG40_09035 [Bacteroidales bacterium]|nr:hypothetical protein [Bacteroidales bacterium]